MVSSSTIPASACAVCRYRSCPGISPALPWSSRRPAASNPLLPRLAGLALAIEVFAMVSPLFLEWVVDQALVTADRDLLLTLVLGFSLLLLVEVAVSAMQDWMVIVLGASLKVQARTNLFSHLINLPASYFEARHLGDVMSRFGSQETILQAITTELVVALLNR